MADKVVAAALGAGTLLGLGAGYCVFGGGGGGDAEAVQAAKPVAVGDSLPAATGSLFDCTNLKGGKMAAANLQALFGKKKAVLTALPGAFTPG